MIKASFPLSIIALLQYMIAWMHMRVRERTRVCARAHTHTHTHAQTQRKLQLYHMCKLTFLAGIFIFSNYFKNI